MTEASYRGKGRPPEVSRCRAFCGILYILRTGCLRRGLPEEYGYWHAAYGRFNRGSERGLRAKVLLAPQKEAGIAFNEAVIDSTIMKARRHGGGQKWRQTKGVSRAGISAKFHPAVTTNGLVAESFLTGGNVNGVEAAPALAEDMVRGFAPADRGYDSGKFRRTLEGNNNVPAIPGRKNRKTVTEYDTKRYKKHSFIRSGVLNPYAFT